MRLRESAFVVLGMLSAGVALSQPIPPGIVLPVMSNNTVDSVKSKVGDKIAGKLMQKITLSSGEFIPVGARIEGEVVEAPPTTGAAAARLWVRFDRIVFRDQQVHVTLSLRALASMQDVFDAQLPSNAIDDYGTSFSDWSTVQIGGAAVYRGDGTVRSAMEIVGKVTDSGAVTAKLMPSPKQGCPGNPANDDPEQSLWVFSPWACGAYGFADLTILHHGTTPPIGTIELTAPAPFRIMGGSGWLLRVVASEPRASASLRAKQGRSRVVRHGDR